MDMIYLFTTDVCCYRYGHDLRARTQFLSDRRLDYRERWTDEEKARFDAEAAAYGEQVDWFHKVFNECRDREPDKTLVEMDYTMSIDAVLSERIRGYYPADIEGNPILEKKIQPETRALVLSFFHSDKETAERYFDASTPEERLARKADWLTCFLRVDYLKTVEIPYDFTLTEEYLRDLFKSNF
ncbi:MAG: hypothetical protein LBD13_08265 [Spirochaetaceae bacterium]|jgi:hypothetical protein|nr:hypothetical protein [Spirochaetaceae bacterium]